MTEENRFCPICWARLEEKEQRVIERREYGEVYSCRVCEKSYELRDTLSEDNKERVIRYFNGQELFGFAEEEDDRTS